MEEKKERKFFKFGYGGISTIILVVIWIATSISMILHHMEQFKSINLSYPFSDARDVIVGNFCFFFIIWIVWCLIIGHWNRLGK